MADRRGKQPTSSTPASAGGRSGSAAGGDGAWSQFVQHSQESSDATSLLELGMALPAAELARGAVDVAASAGGVMHPVTGIVVQSLAAQLEERAQRPESALLHALVQLADFGVVLLDVSGRVAFINEHAQALFDAGAVLKLHRDRLQCNVNAVRQVFEQALDAQCEAASHRLPVEASVLRIPHADGKGLTFIKIQQLAPTQDRAAVQGLAVFVFDGARRRHDRHHSLRELYGLSLAEAKVANLLADGSDIPDIAKRMNIAKNTVRAHLRSTYAKTNTKKQAQLVAQLCRDLLALESLLR